MTLEKLRQLKRKVFLVSRKTIRLEIKSRQFGRSHAQLMNSINTALAYKHWTVRTATASRKMFKRREKKQLGQYFVLNANYLTNHTDQ